jgi:hypothetical protein
MCNELCCCLDIQLQIDDLISRFGTYYVQFDPSLLSVAWLQATWQNIFDLGTQTVDPLDV